MDVLTAAYHVVHDYPGGSESLAPRLSPKKSATTLSHEVKATGTAKFGLLDAVQVTDLSKDLRILQAWATHCDQMLVPLPAVDLEHDECMVRLAAATREFGELCTEVATGLADGVITDNELGRIKLEAGHLVAAVHSMMGSLEARNARGKPFPTLESGA